MEGKRKADWQNKWVDIIEEHHPDFPFLADMRLQRALNKFAWEPEAGIPMMKALAKNKTPEGRWAKEFLKLYSQEKKHKKKE